MDRRDFLRKGALGASGAMVTGGLEEPGSLRVPRSSLTPPADMDAYVRTMDEGMARIGQWSLASSFPSFDPTVSDFDGLAQASMQTLFMSAMFGDLPLESQIDPRVQDRIAAAQHVMDEAYVGMRDFLGSRTPEQLEGVRATLRARPDVLWRITRTLEDEAAQAGVSDVRQSQLRNMFTEVGWRLERQPPSLMVAEYLDKVERVASSDVRLAARERWLAARIGDELLWQAQEQSTRRRRISRGGRLMGIGALLFAGGVLLISIDGDGGVLAWIGLIPGVTGGSIAFTIGLITLLAGLATPESAG